MANYQTHEVMLETLKKVQPYQVEIFKTGRHCHLDGGVYHGIGSGDHINFDLTVFDDFEIVRKFEFGADMTEKELQAEVASLDAYVERIKEED